LNAEVARMAASLVDAGESFALVTIIDSRGSTPRHVGASMLVRADGSITGTVGGGPLEAAVIENALNVLSAGSIQLVHLDSGQLGMLCGGDSLALVEHVDAATPTTRELYHALLELLRSGGRVPGRLGRRGVRGARPPCGVASEPGQAGRDV
jgi:xanthine dehydrogenase accessory factor